MLLELEQQQGLKAQNIFADIQGLASVNTRETPHRHKQVEDYLKKSKEKISEGDSEGVNKNFDRWVDGLTIEDLKEISHRIEKGESFRGIAFDFGIVSSQYGILVDTIIEKVGKTKSLQKIRNAINKKE